MVIRFISRLIKYIISNWIQIILIILSIYDLRIDLRLLFEYFTFTTFFYTILDHPLALTVLIAMPKISNTLKRN